MMIEDSMIPTRSPAGAAAEDIFYESFNDVAFYVEDKEQENLYLEFLRSGLPDIKVEKIFPLDGKKNILRHFDDPSNFIISRRVYLMDKDFDDLLNKQRSDVNLVYLDKFCIENYVINKENIAKIICEDSPKLKLSEINKSLEIDNVIDGTYSSLKRLSFAFYMVQKYGAGLQNVGGGVYRFAEKPDLFSIDDGLESAYIQSVIEAINIQGVTLDTFNNQIDPDGIDFKDMPLDAYICGKCVLSLILKRCKFHYSTTATLEAATYRLAQKSDMSNFTPIIDKIRRALNP